MIGRAREASSLCATRATIGMPSISASSLFGPPIRRDCPAASRSAPIRGPCGFASGLRSVAGVASARGSGRDGISASKPPLPIRMISAGADRQPGDKPLEHPVEAVDLGRAGAAGQAEHRRAPRHGRAAADCRDRPACRNGRSGRRRRRSPPGSRRAGRGSPRRRGSAGCRSRGPSRRGSAPRAPPSRGRSALRTTSRQPSAVSRPSVTSRVLSRMLSFSPGSRVWISPTERGTKGRDAQQRPVRASPPRRNARPPPPVRQTG